MKNIRERYIGDVIVKTPQKVTKLDPKKIDPKGKFIHYAKTPEPMRYRPFNTEDLSDYENYSFSRKKSKKIEKHDRAIIHFTPVLGGGFSINKIYEADSGKILWESLTESNALTFEDFKDMVTDLGGDYLTIKVNKPFVLVSKRRVQEVFKG